ncbi:hypothetical protein [Cytobacillus sp. FSL R5-0596]|uniref:hypothetical protein n=1 Tax=Cytobacillus sp. FSL R5-0596 TaxID=2954696 RepID=UPI0030F94C62|nr:hypothetical protein [Cytobacillus firmus]
MCTVQPVRKGEEAVKGEKAGSAGCMPDRFITIKKGILKLTGLDHLKERHNT